MGKPLDQEITVSRLPWMRFEMQGSRVHGFSGCNRFSGTFDLTAGNRIRFLPMAVTKMACLDMNVETDDSFHLDDRELVLFRARMAPLARFRAVDDKKQ